MAGGSIRGVEYVVTDEARNVIAVVRPISPRQPRRMPRWAENEHSFAVVASDGASGLAFGAGPWERWRRGEWRVIVEGSTLIGMIGPGFPRSHMTFRDCACGRRRRKCQCGGRRGRLHRWSSADGAWTVVNAADHELARITPRRFVIDLGPEDTREACPMGERGAFDVHLRAEEELRGRRGRSGFRLASARPSRGARRVLRQRYGSPSQRDARRRVRERLLDRRPSIWYQGFVARGTRRCGYG
jgi:hypothetical protein